MDHEAIHRLQTAVVTAKQAAHQATLDSCDVGDLDEAFEAIDLELAKRTSEQKHPHFVSQLRRSEPDRRALCARGTRSDR